MHLHDWHIKLDCNQYKRFRAAIKKLGYKTASAFVREKIRQAIREAEEIEKVSK